MSKTIDERIDDLDLPQWALDQLAEARSKRRHPAGKRRGLITIIPDGVEPEVWGAQNGFA